jgi:dTMP kinase
MNGALIVLEGIEGAGKSTQVRRLVRRLEAAAIDCLAVREPGGTAAGDAIRHLLLDPASLLDARAEALLFMASRAQLVADVIQPALQRGAIVVADRFFLSTYAYQISGRGLPEDAVREANALATGGLVPHLNLLLDLPADDGLARAAGRSAHDRIERAAPDFHGRVREAFVSFADPVWQRAHPEAGPIVLIDGSGDESTVASRVSAEVARRWPQTAPALAGSHS